MVFDYDDLTVSGRFFHLNGNVRKHKQQIGLQRRYQTDPEFALLLRHIPALAFVPIQHLIETFETLEEIMPDEMLPLLDYFERTYIGRRLRARRRANPDISAQQNRRRTFWLNIIGAEKNEPTWLYSALIKKKIRVLS